MEPLNRDSVSHLQFRTLKSMCGEGFGQFRKGKNTFKLTQAVIKPESKKSIRMVCELPVTNTEPLSRDSLCHLRLGPYNQCVVRGLVGSGWVRIHRNSRCFLPVIPTFVNSTLLPTAPCGMKCGGLAGTRLSQDNRFEQRRSWLLLGLVAAERSCLCKQPACPAIGGGSQIRFRDSYLALTSAELDYWTFPVLTYFKTGVVICLRLHSLVTKSLDDKVFSGALNIVVSRSLLLFRTSFSHAYLGYFSP
ncbi:hypothetical protein J6590_008156 [Homalodisca vitripennis]|nr:hypothetical protein J6590_008156 [Homalodisca vitripennis]